jgi:hypothetical protein
VRASQKCWRGVWHWAGERVGAGHFIYIPAILFIGIVIGWVLGTRAVRDAYAAELRKRAVRSDERS